MSRSLTMGVLAILVVLLGVMSYMTAPKPPKEADPAEIAKAEQTRKEEQEREREQRKAMMEQIAKSKPAQDAIKAAQHPTAPPPKPKRTSTSIEITNTWYRDRKPGTEGVAQMKKEIEEAKQREEAEAKARGLPASNVPRLSPMNKQIGGKE